MLEFMDGLILALVGLATTAGLVGYRLLLSRRAEETQEPQPKPPPTTVIVEAATSAITENAKAEREAITEAAEGKQSPAALAASRRGKR